MGTSLRISHSWLSLGFALAAGLSGGGLTHADATTPAAKTGEAPQGSFMSSLTQAFKQDFDHQVVRGHFDVGTPPDTVRRYYCLVDAKTGKRQPNGVDGQPFLRPDGMTGIKGTAVSLYGCAGSEQQGLLVTTGYVLIGGAAAQAASPAPAAASLPATSAPAGVTASGAPATGAPAGGSTTVVAAPAPSPPSAASAPASPYRVDVAGVQLGMSLDQVRTVLQSKKLLDYHESMQTLGHLEPANGTAAPVTGARFVNGVAAWTAPVDGDGEAFEVMFTPVPGGERAMAIIHSVAYSPAHAVRLSALAGGLVRKYGGYAGADALPAAPTWRVRNDSVVQTGDPCKRRGVFGGLADAGAAKANRPNLALKTTPEEFRYQIDLCGMAIVTEDHAVARDAAARGDPAITRFTVTAYSPAIGFEGATAAAQLMQANMGADGADTGATRRPDVPVPNL